MAKHTRASAEGGSLRTPPAALRVERLFRVDPVRAWTLLTDTASWPDWGPSLRQVECSERIIRSGSRGRVYLPFGPGLPFRITEYIEGAYWAWRVAGVRATGHRLLVHGSASCTVRFELPVLWLPYRRVCRIALDRLAGRLEA